MQVTASERAADRAAPAGAAGQAPARLRRRRRRGRSAGGSRWPPTCCSARRSCCTSRSSASRWSASCVISFVQWDLISPPHFVGPAATTGWSAHDPQLGQTLSNTFLFDIMTTAIHIVLGLGLALAVTTVRSRVVRYWARTAIVTPFLMSAGVVALMWSYIMADTTGPLNYYLHQDRPATRRTGWPRAPGRCPRWSSSTSGPRSASRSSSSWSGCRTSPRELYEAASIDGAGAWARFRTITLPMLSPGHVHRLGDRVHRRVRDLHLAADRHQRRARHRHADDPALHLPRRLPELPVRLQRRGVADQRRHPGQLRGRHGPAGQAVGAL